MKLILSEDLVLRDWYQTAPVNDWIRQDDSVVNKLSFTEHSNSPITRVYFHHTVSDHFSFVFTGRLHFMNKILRDTYEEEWSKKDIASSFRHDQPDEAKAFIDQFIVRMYNLRAFL